MDSLSLFPQDPAQLKNGPWTGSDLNPIKKLIKQEICLNPYLFLENKSIAFSLKDYTYMKMFRRNLNLLILSGINIKTKIVYVICIRCYGLDPDPRKRVQAALAITLTLVLAI